MRKLPKMVFTDCGRAYLAGYVASARPSVVPHFLGHGFLTRTILPQACGVESEGYVYTMVKAPAEGSNDAGGRERQ